MHGTERYRVQADGSTLEIFIYGDIGEGWFMDGVSAADIARVLRDNDGVKTIALRINSVGGDVFEGNAIYNQLVRHPARVTVDIDGLAASAASIIAMAGDERRIGSNGFLMIHEAWSLSIGPAKEHEAMASRLRKINETMIDVYALRASVDRKDIAAKVEAETWMTAQEAMDVGLVHSVTEPAQIEARTSAVMAAGHFRNMPAEARKFFEKARGTGGAPLLDVAASASTPQPPKDAAGPSGSPNEREAPEDTDMTEKEDPTLKALGVKSQADAMARMGVLQRIEAMAGKDGEEAIGVLMAWKNSHEKLPEMQAEIEKLRADGEKRELDELIKAGKDEKKLTPAAEKTLRAQVEAGEVTIKGAKAMLENMSPIAALQQASDGSRPQTSSTDDGELKWKGKAYSELKGMEKHKLKRDEPELFERMRADAEAQGLL